MQQVKETTSGEEMKKRDRLPVLSFLPLPAAMSSTSGQLSHYGSIYSATASSMQPPTPSAPPGLASSPPVRLAQPQPTRLPQSSTEARVVVLLDGEQVQVRLRAVDQACQRPS